MRLTPALLLLLLALPIPRSAGAATDASQLVIYVETAAETVMPAKLELGAVTLESRETVIELRPVRRTLDSAELAGTQRLFIDQPIAPGQYDTLRLQITAIDTHVGQASVKPDAPAGGVAIPVDLDIRRDECGFRVLRWRPTLPDESAVHRPQLELRLPEVPPLGSVAFVSNEGSNNVTVVELASGRVVDCIATGRGPRGLAFSALDQLLFVALAGEDAVAVYEATSRRLLQLAPLRFGDEPSRLELSSEERRLYVLNPGSDSITILSVPGMQDMGRIPVGTGPRSLARDESTGHLFVACETAGEVLVVDPRAGRQVASLPVDSTPVELAFDQGTATLHVASGLRRRVVMVDVETGETRGQIDLCAVAEGLAFEPTSRRLFAAAGHCGTVAVLAPAAGMELRAISLDNAPGLIAVSADRRRLLATLPAVDRLAICNITGARLEASLETGRHPYAVIAP